MPMSLFKLPCVAKTFESLPAATFKIAANISLTVVLPLLPVIATIGALIFLRQYAAKSPNAKRASFTFTAGAFSLFSINAAAAPCAKL